MAKQLVFSEEARKALKKGVDTLASSNLFVTLFSDGSPEDLVEEKAGRTIESLTDIFIVGQRRKILLN